MTIVDQARDLSGTETHRLTSLHAPPDFVKTASREQLCGPGDTSLPAHLYADQVERAFPCHTKAATWMSALFFMHHYDALGQRAAQIGQRIEKQAAAFGIQCELDELKVKVAQSLTDDLAQLPDEQFALVWVTDDTKERHYPLRNPGEVKLAAAWFHQYRDDFVFADRQRMAERIDNRARELGVATEHDDMLQKTAGYGHCAAQTIVAALQKRAGLVARSKPEHATELRALAEAVDANHAAARESAYRLKLAGLLDQFDRQTQLHRLYGEGGLERPEEFLFQVTEKVARDFVDQHIQLTSGTVYEKAALELLPMTTVRDWMGKELADAVAPDGLNLDVTKLAAIVPTLPRDSAAMFDRMATVAGIPVFARDKAAHATGLTIDEMLGLAEQYQPAAAGAPALLGDLL